MTADELRAKFEHYRDVFKGTDAGSKYDAASAMLADISEFLGEHVESIDVWPITMVMAEYAKIGEGNAPDFLKAAKKTGGRARDPLKNMNDANLVAAVQVLHNDGKSLAESFEYVAARSWLNVDQLRQLRKDFRRDRRLKEAKDYIFEQSQLQFPGGFAVKHVSALLVIANQSHESAKTGSNLED